MPPSVGLMLYVVAPSAVRARRLQDAAAPGLRNRDAVYVLPGANDLRGRRFCSGDSVVFDAEYVSAGDQAMWSQLSGAEWSLTLGELRASQRGDMAVGLMDAQLYDLVPDIGVPPIDDPVALAKWLLT